MDDFRQFILDPTKRLDWDWSTLDIQVLQTENEATEMQECSESCFIFTEYEFRLDLHLFHNEKRDCVAEIRCQVLYAIASMWLPVESGIEQTVDATASQNLPDIPMRLPARSETFEWTTTLQPLSSSMPFHMSCCRHDEKLGPLSDVPYDVKDLSSLL